MEALLISLPSILLCLSFAFQNEPKTTIDLEHTRDKKLLIKKLSDIAIKDLN